MLKPGSFYAATWKHPFNSVLWPGLFSLNGIFYDIKTLAEKVFEKYNVSIGELRSGGRRRAVVKARPTMSWISVRELGYSGADVARYLGVLPTLA